MYDIKGWDLYDSKTKYRSDLTSMWGHPDLSHVNNFRVNFILHNSKCYTNQKNVLNLFFNSKEYLYSIQVFYQNKYTTDTIKYYISNIIKGINSNCTDELLCKIMSMKRPAIIVGKTFDRNKNAEYQLIRFEAVDIFDNRRFSRYYRGFNYINGGIGLWRPELHKFIYHRSYETTNLFGPYHPDLCALKSNYSDNWSINYLNNNTRYYDYYRDFMCDGSFLASVDGIVFNNDMLNNHSYFKKYINWTDISFNSGCCYSLEESNVWNSFDNDFNDIRGPFGAGGGGTN